MKHWTLACLMGLALLSACSSKSGQDANAQNGAGGTSGYGAGGRVVSVAQAERAGQRRGRRKIWRSPSGTVSFSRLTATC